MMSATELTRDEIDEIVATATTIAPLKVRKMFGTKCLYDDDVMLGIVHTSGLYLKIDDATRGSYDATHQPIFAPKPGMGWTSFRLVPAGATGSEDALRPWLSDAIAVASLLASKKVRQR